MAVANKIISFDSFCKNRKRRNMAVANKIISFDSFCKKRKRKKYILKHQISLYMCKQDNYCFVNWSSPPYDNITKEEIYSIIKSIFSKLAKKGCMDQIQIVNNYNFDITLLYYENINRKGDFKYICIPQNITDEKLATYLLALIAETGTL